MLSCKKYFTHEKLEKLNFITQHKFLNIHLNFIRHQTAVKFAKNFSTQITHFKNIEKLLTLINWIQ